MCVSVCTCVETCLITNASLKLGSLRVGSFLLNRGRYPTPCLYSGDQHKQMRIHRESESKNKRASESKNKRASEKGTARESR
jgi:hypothetical protein